MCSINLANSATMPIVANGANNGSSKSSGVRRMTVQVSDKFGPTVNSAKFSGGGAGSQYTQSTFSTRGETAKKLSGTFLLPFYRFILLQYQSAEGPAQNYRHGHLEASVLPNCLPDN